jgi:prepilin-type N-terminal cleavage/methylation domain-containing protein
MKNKKGVTLVELVFTLALIGIVLTIVVAIFMFGNRNFSTQNKQSEAVATARYSMDYITKQVRMANIIEVVDNKILVNSSEIKLENNTLFNDGQVIVNGIDDMTVVKNGNEIVIDIVIDKGGTLEYSISSVLYIR